MNDFDSKNIIEYNKTKLLSSSRRKVTKNNIVPEPFQQKNQKEEYV
jgi:hypothetical protein